jgi:hypothetical protein
MPLKLYKRGKIYHFAGTVAGRRLRGSCKTAEKAIAARKVAEIEANEWKRDLSGPQEILTFAQAAMLYRQAGKNGQTLARIEDYFRDTLVKDINGGIIKQMAHKMFPNCSGASKNRMAIVPAQAIINHAAELELCQPIRVKGRFEVKTEEKTLATLDG